MCRRSRRGVAALLVAVSIQADGQATAVPLSDSTLGRLLAPTVFDLLRGGGYRLGMQWIAGDPLTHAALATASSERELVLRPPPGRLAAARRPAVRPTPSRIGSTSASSSMRLGSWSVGFRMSDRTPGGFAEGNDTGGHKDSDGLALGTTA